MIRMDGEQRGRWTVIKPEKERYKHGEEVRWICKCICGTEKSVKGTCLRNGSSKSCGCLSREMTSIRNKNNTKHKMSGTKLYTTWIGIKQRCYYKKMRQYKYYGHRGISVCDEWRNDFKAFYDWAIKNKWKPDLQIDRKDNNKGYSPNNCRIVSPGVNARNRTTSRYWFINGVRYDSAVEASHDIGLATSTIQHMCLGRKETKNRKAKAPLPGCYTIKKYKKKEKK